MSRHSISRWLMGSFIVFLAVMSIALSVANYNEHDQLAIQNMKNSSSSCATIINYVMEKNDLDSLRISENSEEYQNLQSSLRFLCDCFNQESIAIYTIDPQSGDRTYIIRVSEDGKSDLGLGYVEKGNPLPGEMMVLAGEANLESDRIAVGGFKIISITAPYLDDKGNILALIRMNYKIANLEKKTLGESMHEMIVVLIILVTGLLLLWLLVRRRIVKPINAISTDMKEFSRSSGQKPAHLNLPMKDEIGEIAGAYVKMTEDISFYINNIEVLTKIQLETDIQLEIARSIQHGLVPAEKTLNEEYFSARALTRPAKAVGGDFYDCFLLDENTLCMVMGDVSGKGVSAAIFMALVKTMISEKLKMGLDPAQTLNLVNEELYEQNPENLFVTVFVAVFNTFTGELRYANAGHTYPVLAGESPRIFKPDTGIVLGLFDDISIEEGSLHLDVSEGIVLYTDGVTEAVNPQKEFFGSDRLVKAVQGAADADEVLAQISEAVYDFCREEEQFDDVTVLAVFRKPIEEIWQALPVSLSSFETVKETVFNLAGNNAKARKTLLACEEVFTNIVNYSGAKHLSFLCRKEGDILQVSFKDDGTPFNLMELETEDKEFERLAEGGMGVNIIRQIALYMWYTYKDNQNLFTMYFKVDTPEQE